MDWVFAHDIGSAVTLDESRKLAELAQGKTVLEVGSFFGRSTVALASTADVVHCIDWHRGETIALKDTPYGGPVDSLVGWRDNMVRYGLLDKVVLHMGTTKQVCPFLKARLFDLVFIDADHTYDGVSADIRHVEGLLAENAVVAFHDYTFADLGVADAARDFYNAEPDVLVDSLAIYLP